jgi:hypothetical protein
MTREIISKKEYQKVYLKWEASKDGQWKIEWSIVIIWSIEYISDQYRCDNQARMSKKN